MPKERYIEVRAEDPATPGGPSGFVRHDGQFVSVSTANAEDLKFMAAEEESAGKIEVANELRALAARKRE